MRDFKFKNIIVRAIKTGFMDNNSWLVINTGNNEGFIVDASFDPEIIITGIKDSGVLLRGILLTHGHYDHIMSAAQVKEEFEAPVFAAETEVQLLSDKMLNLSYKPGRFAIELEADDMLNDGDILDLAGLKIKVIATPGHTAGGICFYLEEFGILFTGDTLFYGSHGRTDLPTGDSKTLKESIINKLFVLPKDTIAFPGHGDATDIGFEKVNNPIYLR